jgi:two-component system, chemotaxis family, protein-glutamate methylesterase/glutaminase
VSKIRVLVVDDAVVVRKILTTVIDQDPELEVVGIAANGQIALSKIEALKPDIITLDIEMPVLDGIGTLREIRKTNKLLPIIMFSTLTERGASATMEALSLGASDYVTKPANVGSVTAAMEAVRAELIPKIKAFCRKGPPQAPPPRPAGGGAPSAPLTGRTDVIAIGSSTGGPNALSSVLTGLPAGFDKPILIAQHMPALFTKYLAERLDGATKIRVREAKNGDVAEPGLALIAPGDFHMTFRRGPSGPTVVLSQTAPVNFCRPSVDVMFNSIADIYGGNVLAVVLTGMGHDGRDGCATLKKKGARVIAQDQATSVVWGMPGAVHGAGLADRTLPLDDIAGAITQGATGGARIREKV